MFCLTEELPQATFFKHTFIRIQFLSYGIYLLPFSQFILFFRSLLLMANIHFKFSFLQENMHWVRHSVLSLTSLVSPYNLIQLFYASSLYTLTFRKINLNSTNCSDRAIDRHDLSRIGYVYFHSFSICLSVVAQYLHPRHTNTYT